MNYGLFWRRLTWVLMGIWTLLWGTLMFAGDDRFVVTGIIILIVGNLVILGLARAIAWIFSGLTEEDQT